MFTIKVVLKIRWGKIKLLIYRIHLNLCGAQKAPRPVFERAASNRMKGGIWGAIGAPFSTRGRVAQWLNLSFSTAALKRVRAPIPNRGS